VRVNVPCASLAKKQEEVFVPKRNEPIIIPRKSQALKILQYARDEAHRFGVAYNRLLRKIPN
ncbi:MAG: excinuclease ABC subunit C, partial [Nitrosopumilaceae archaeon]